MISPLDPTFYAPAPHRRASVSRPMPVAMAATTWCTMASRRVVEARPKIRRFFKRGCLNTVTFMKVKVELQNLDNWMILDDIGFSKSLEIWKLELSIGWKLGCSSRFQVFKFRKKGSRNARHLVLITSWQQQVLWKAALLFLSTNQNLISTSLISMCHGHQCMF